MIRFSVVYTIVCLAFLQSCKTGQVSPLEQHGEDAKSTSQQLADLFTSYQNDHQLFSGLMIADAESMQILFSQNEDKFFTPASNTKLFTFLASLHYLSDSIPALQYVELGDSLIIRGTGDPTFLNKYDVDSVAFHFLSQTNKSIYIDNSLMTTGRFGSGWSWDDFAYYYQKENSVFPVAGQATRISVHPDSLDFKISPQFMKTFIKTDLSAPQFLSREEFSNVMTINPLHQPSYAREYEIPFYQDSSFTVRALSELLGKKINQLEDINDYPYETLYQLNSDSLYKELMLNSDNFVAEQLLFLIGSKLDIELSTRKIIRRILEDGLFAPIPDRPRWVDGSGLSRYNLATPRSMIWVLDRLDDYLTHEEIKNWFPSSEHLGTLPKGLDRLNLFAKTGTLSNNFCLSGYLKTSSGKRLIFSWMNNHFIAPKKTIASDMEMLLQFVQEEF